LLNMYSLLLSLCIDKDYYVIIKFPVNETQNDDFFPLRR